MFPWSRVSSLPENNAPVVVVTVYLRMNPRAAHLAMLRVRPAPSSASLHGSVQRETGVESCALRLVQ